MFFPIYSRISWFYGVLMVSKTVFDGVLMVSMNLWNLPTFAPSRRWWTANPIQGDQVVNRSLIGSKGRGPHLSKRSIMIDLIRLAQEAPGTIISIQVKDLVSANERLVERTIADLERMIAERRETIYMTKDQVLAKLNVAPSTLWRWQKRGYLVPVKVGGENRYRSTDIDKILEVQ